MGMEAAILAVMKISIVFPNNNSSKFKIQLFQKRIKKDFLKQK